MRYPDLPPLADVYFEDSYVLAIHELDDSVVFDLDVVLREGHSLYEHPRNEEQYCYRRASLVFSGVSSIEWQRKQFIQFTDAADVTDLGNIDDFSVEDGEYRLEGDWGAVTIICASVVLSFLRNGDKLGPVPGSFTGV